jgi:hypothetical protein
MFRSMWRRLDGGHFLVRGSGRRPRLSYADKYHRLSLEVFEDRALLSTFTVVDLGDAGVGSGLQGDLRYAITTANRNTDLSNRIVFQPGLTGTVTVVRGTFVISKALAISGPGADVLTVSGNHQSGVFDIEAPAGQTVILSDLTVADGTGAGEYHTFPAGGGLFNDAATLVLDRTTFSRNTLPPEPLNAGGGGALFNDHGSVTMNGATITDNHGDRITGLAVENFGTMAVHHSTVSGNTGTLLQSTIGNGGTMTLEDSVISGNSSNIGNNGTITLTRCTVTQNTSGFGGGLSTGGIAVITDSTIADNVASPTGGGIFGGGQVTVRGSTISGNTATYAGGIFLEGGRLTVTDSTISGNTAGRQGGGVLIGGVTGRDGVAEITSSTITGNVTTENYSTDWGGGGIYTELRTVLDNTIVAGNQSAGQGPDVNGSVISLGYNLIGATDESSGWTGTDRTGTSANPLDPVLGPLQDNGGPTLTHAVLTGSPALGGGDQAVNGSTDQRGSVRQFVRPDIGAFQTEPATQFRVLAPATVDGGRPFDVTVIAVDEWGNTASTYTGTVHFSSTDLFAQLPGDTSFSGADAGAHTFTVTLQTPGTQAIGVVDTRSASITGSVTVEVAAGLASPKFAAAFWDVFAWGADGGGWQPRRR